MFNTERSQDEIEDQIAEAQSGNNRWPGMSFEEGVAAALLWITGDRDEAPMED